MMKVWRTRSIRCRTGRPHELPKSEREWVCHDVTTDHHMAGKAVGQERPSTEGFPLVAFGAVSAVSVSAAHSCV